MDPVMAKRRELPRDLAPWNHLASLWRDRPMPGRVRQLQIVISFASSIEDEISQEHSRWRILDNHAPFENGEVTMFKIKHSTRMARVMEAHAL